MADDWASNFDAQYGGVNLGGLDFNFNILGNVDWSPFETFMSDPHNWNREMAKLDAGLAVLANSPALTDPTFYERFFAGDPDAIALDKSISAQIDEARNNAEKTYNEMYGIGKDTTPKFEKYVYVGECANRMRYDLMSDGSKINPTAAPEKCGQPPVVSATTVTVPAPVTPPPVTPTPPTPPPPPPPPPPAKTAPIDTILYPSDDLLPIEIMADLIFEDIGGQELINVARTDTVNGQTVVYQPIKNLTQIQQQYNPNNIVSLDGTSDKYFKNFAIKIESKTPYEGNGPAGEHVYIDSTTGDLIIEAINIEADEQVEVQIVTSGTIYEAEL